MCAEEGSCELLYSARNKQQPKKAGRSETDRVDFGPCRSWRALQDGGGEDVGEELS